MEINVDTPLIISERKARAWSQQQLADISSLSLRTIQRIEKTGVSSQDSLKAVSSAFDKAPFYFLYTGKEPLLCRGARKVLAFCFSLIMFAIGALYFARVSAESIELNINYRSENASTNETNIGSWEYLATIGSNSELNLPNGFILMIHPAIKHGNEVALDISLKSKAGKPIIPNHDHLSVVGSLEDGVNLKFEKEGGLLVNIKIGSM